MPRRPAPILLAVLLTVMGWHALPGASVPACSGFGVDFVFGLRPAAASGDGEARLCRPAAEQRGGDEENGSPAGGSTLTMTHKLTGAWARLSGHSKSLAALRPASHPMDAVRFAADGSPFFCVPGRLPADHVTCSSCGPRSPPAA